jgi:hypothetical protein
MLRPYIYLPPRRSLKMLWLIRPLADPYRYFDGPFVQSRNPG